MHTKKIKSPRLRADEVAAILNCAKSTVWKWAKEGRIPAPHKEGNRFTYWLRTEVEAFACCKNLTNSNGTI